MTSRSVAHGVVMSEGFENSGRTDLSALVRQAAPPRRAGPRGGVVYIVVVVAYAAAPTTTAVGYQPDQPVDYSHRLHAGELGMDCRYCHNTVESAAHAADPAHRRPA